MAARGIVVAVKVKIIFSLVIAISFSVTFLFCEQRSLSCLIMEQTSVFMYDKKGFCLRILWVQTRHVAKGGWRGRPPPPPPWRPGGPFSARAARRKGPTRPREAQFLESLEVLRATRALSERQRAPWRAPWHQRAPWEWGPFNAREWGPFNSREGAL